MEAGQGGEWVLRVPRYAHEWVRWVSRMLIGDFQPCWGVGVWALGAGSLGNSPMKWVEGLIGGWGWGNRAGGVQAGTCDPATLHGKNRKPSCT